MGIYDSPTSGNLLAWVALTTPKTINNGDPAPAFAIGALTWTGDQSRVADNTTLNAGSGGDTIATDDLGGSVKVQRVKVGWGPDGTLNDTDDAAGKGLPVNVRGSGSLALQASQTSGVTNATTTRTTTTGLDIYADLDTLLNVTGAGAATGTLNLYLQILTQLRRGVRALISQMAVRAE